MPTKDVLEFIDQICHNFDCSFCPLSVQDYEGNPVCAWSAIENFLNLVAKEEERR